MNITRHWNLFQNNETARLLPAVLIPENDFVPLSYRDTSLITDRYWILMSSWNLSTYTCHPRHSSITRRYPCLRIHLNYSWCCQRAATYFKTLLCGQENIEETVTRHYMWAHNQTVFLHDCKLHNVNISNYSLIIHYRLQISHKFYCYYIQIH